MSYFLKMGLLCASILAVTGCQKESGSSTAALHTLSENKPRVALIPVIDHTPKTYEWSVGEELSERIASNLIQGGLSLASRERMSSLAKKMKGNPFGPQVGWIKEMFSGENFVIFLELITHEETFRIPKAKEVNFSTCAADLNMSMRIRVFDLRGKEPVVVLQELVHDTHFIPKQFTRVNFDQVSWGEEDFDFSPVGMAHVQFTKQIARRIEDYIAIALN